MLDVKIYEHEDTQTWIKVLEFGKKGDAMPGHAHTFDHTHIIHQGAIRLKTWDMDAPDNCIEEDFHGPQIITIPAHKVHTLIAMEDNTISQCTHIKRKKEVIGVGEIQVPLTIS